MPSDPIALPWNSIDVASRALDLDPALVGAIVIQESGGNPWKVRYEPAYTSLWFPRESAEKRSLSVQTMETCQKMSWGLMQVMGAVALEHGFKGELPELCDVDTGLKWGCIHLKWLQGRFGPDECNVISAYNAGHPGRTPGGLYVNQRYVDGVSTFLRQIRASGTAGF